MEMVLLCFIALERKGTVSVPASVPDKQFGFGVHFLAKQFL